MFRCRGALRRLGTMADDLVLREKVGKVSVVTLNNPSKLNALNHPMAVRLRDIWIEEENDQNCCLLLLKGAGEKAFCAGGDVVGVRKAAIGESGEQGLAPEEFFRSEYQFNQRVAVNTLPQVSLWHGIVMGGGVGASVHGRVRVACEKTMFAMPETQIGLFPDVGGSFWMPRLLHGPGLGMYLGLTGVRLYAMDLLLTGIATHYCPADLLPRLEEQLVAQDHSELRRDPDRVHDVVAEALSNIGASPPSKDDVQPSALEAALPYIEEVFGGALQAALDNYPRGHGHAGVAGMESLMVGLESASAQTADAAKQEWAKKTQESLSKMSPTSLLLTTEYLVHGLKFSTIDECLQMEFRLGKRCVDPNGDFVEGVRALLVEKDKSPKWNPAPSAEELAVYFTPLDPSDELSFVF